MVKTLLGGLSLLNEFNKRGDDDKETPDENFVGGDDDETRDDPTHYAPMLGFKFETGITEPEMREMLDGIGTNGTFRSGSCTGQRQCRKGTNINGAKENRLEHSNNFAGSAGHKHNQKKMNDQVGVDASRRLFRLKVKQNRIENDCVNRLNNKNTPSQFLPKPTCSHNCGGCEGNTQFDFKVHTRRNGTYERYYLKRGRTMLTDEERTECGNMGCRCPKLVADAGGCVQKAGAVKILNVFGYNPTVQIITITVSAADFATLVAAGLETNKQPNNNAARIYDPSSCAHVASSLVGAVGTVDGAANSFTLFPFDGVEGGGQPLSAVKIGGYITIDETVP